MIELCFRAYDCGLLEEGNKTSDVINDIAKLLDNYVRDHEVNVAAMYLALEEYKNDLVNHSMVQPIGDKTTKG